MKKLLLILLTLFSSQVFAQDSVKDSLHAISNFSLISDNLSTSGMPYSSQFRWIQKAGFDHVISLNEGDYTFERDSLTKFGITFSQIEVSSKNPSPELFKTFVEDMKDNQGKKILVHCKTNRKASAFVYAYRVNELNADQKEAYKMTYMMWEPHGGFPDAWNSFFKDVLKKD